MCDVEVRHLLDQYDTNGEDEIGIKQFVEIMTELQEAVKNEIDCYEWEFDEDTESNGDEDAQVKRIACEECPAPVEQPDGTEPSRVTVRPHPDFHRLWL